MRQCELLGLNRSSYYYEVAKESEYNEYLMRKLDEQYTQTPFGGESDCCGECDDVSPSPGTSR